MEDLGDSERYSGADGEQRRNADEEGEVDADTGLRGSIRHTSHDGQETRVHIPRRDFALGEEGDQGA